MNKQTPHAYRRSEVNFWIGLPALILIVALIILACSCRPQRSGCYGTKGMSGYSWLKCTETKKVFILDKKEAIACTYIDNGK